MKEILGNELTAFFKNAGIEAKRTYKGEQYEVWELSNTDFKKICDMTEEDFDNLKCNEDSWWRSASGSNLRVPDTYFVVHGEKLLGWDTPIYGSKKGTEYCSLSEYLCECIGASQPKNVCALAVDLAKYNNMKMGELFNKYEF